MGEGTHYSATWKTFTVSTSSPAKCAIKPSEECGSACHTVTSKQAHRLTQVTPETCIRLDSLSADNGKYREHLYCCTDTWLIRAERHQSVRHPAANQCVLLSCMRESSDSNKKCRSKLAEVPLSSTVSTYPAKNLQHYPLKEISL